MILAATLGVQGAFAARGAAEEPAAAAVASDRSAWSPRWVVHLEPVTGLGNYRVGGYWRDLTLAGLSGEVRSGPFASEVGGRLLLSPGYDIFGRLGVIPTLIHGRYWSLALPILAELRYTRLAGVDYSMYHQIWALLAGVEFVHRWRTVGVGARLLLGVSGDLAYRWDYESTWHSGSPTPDQDRAEARLDFSVHFN